MRIHEIVDAIPEGTASIYICHAPDGVCKVLSPEGSVYDHPNVNDQRNLAPAVGLLFDAHWRGANAQEIAAHPWPKGLHAGAVTAEERDSDAKSDASR